MKMTVVIAPIRIEDFDRDKPRAVREFFLNSLGMDPFDVNSEV